jgi:hypothetical protein
MTSMDKLFLTGCMLLVAIAAWCWATIGRPR